MSKSVDNLKSAFAGESQANRDIAFARKADEEGYSQVAKLFRAAAESETVHALNHLQVIGDVKSTRENVEAALTGETLEFREMYPEYLGIARREANKQATWSFEVANKVEQVHAGLFGRAAKALTEGKEPTQTDYYVCGDCGNTVEGAAPERCPVCGAPKAKYFRVN